MRLQWERNRKMRERVECLAARVRETDFLARYGGQEFVMILAGTSLADARKGV